MLWMSILGSGWASPNYYILFSWSISLTVQYLKAMGYLMGIESCACLSPMNLVHITTLKRGEVFGAWL